MKICVIDSGFERSALPDSIDITGIEFVEEFESFAVKKRELTDTIGHGTAVVSTILEQNKNIELIMCKIFEDDFMADTEKLIFILDYIYDNIDCDILHMSFGITECDCISHLKKICQKINDRGTYIVSAFDNNGAVSYPACFDSVIGVDSFIPYTGYKYQLIENSVVNVRLNIGLKRFTVNGQHYIFNGSSFAAAYITGLLSIRIESDKLVTFLELLGKEANSVENNEASLPQITLPVCKKAVIFPFNKEMHSLIKFSEQLPFKIEHIFDSPRSGNVGKNLEEYLQTVDSKAMNIENINNINWDDDFDLFVLGHQKKLSKLEHKDYESFIVEKCKQHNKTLFSFDEPKITYDNVYLPHIQSRFFSNTYQKLYQISSPVVGIFGTSSSQGKFTLQLTLRKLLKADGYRVGHLGTEPQSELFGIDCVYPSGYNQKINLSQEKQALVINQMMAEIDQKQVDIILCGSQSGTVPYMQKNIQFVAHMQMVYAFAVMPDLSIICVNEFDDIEYIQRTINFLESIENNHVLALALYPKSRISLTTQASKYRWLNQEELDETVYKFKIELKKDVFIMTDNGINDLYIKMIESLS